MAYENMLKSLLIRKSRVKPHWLKWLKFKRLTIPSVDKYAGQLEVSAIAGKMWNGTAPLENKVKTAPLAVS